MSGLSTNTFSSSHHPLRHLLLAAAAAASDHGRGGRGGVGGRGHLVEDLADGPGGLHVAQGHSGQVGLIRPQSSAKKKRRERSF